MTNSKKSKAKKHPRITGRLVLNIVVFILVVAVIYFARDDIIESWYLLPTVNLVILSLLIPIQILSYFGRGMIFWTYLKGRGELKDRKISEAFRVALEINFIDTIFPSGGVSGVAYTIWRMGKIGVGKSLTLLSQLLRGVLTLVAYVSLLTLSLIIVVFQGKGEPWLLGLAGLAILGLVVGILIIGYLLGNKKRITGLSKWFIKLGNKVVQKVTLGKVKKDVIPMEKSVEFMTELHEDYLVLASKKKLLIKPLFWAFVHIMADIALFVTAFFAVGVEFNLAVLVVAYGVASGIANVLFTPGGTGGFEASMISIMAIFGTFVAGATSAVVLSRAILVLGTIASGYIVYYQAMKKYGKPPELKK